EPQGHGGLRVGACQPQPRQFLCRPGRSARVRNPRADLFRALKEHTMNSGHSDATAVRRYWGPITIGVVLLVLGLFFIIGGVYLLTLGGTPYYLLIGIGLVLTGLGLIFARGWSLWLYFIVLLGTLIWAVVEVGFERFALALRLWLPIAVGIYLLMPWVAHRLDEH